MTDIIGGLIILVIVAIVVIYIRQQKKKGITCIGCPDAPRCKQSKNDNCSCNHENDNQSHMDIHIKKIQQKT